MTGKFDFSKDMILENDAVLLRPLEYSDFEHLLEFALHEPELWTYSLSPVAGAESLRKYIEVAIKGRDDKTQYPFIVFDKAKGKYAGCTRFHFINFPNKSLHIGYTWYGKEFQGTKLNKNCKLLLLDFAFGEMDMARVEFRADNKNEKSIAAMKSIGCTIEGILRQENLTASGYRRDTIILSILQDEWEKGLRQKLNDKIKE